MGTCRRRGCFTCVIHLFCKYSLVMYENTANLVKKKRKRKKKKKEKRIERRVKYYLTITFMTKVSEWFL